MRLSRKIMLPLGAGFGGSALLTAVYFGIVSLAETPQHALDLFWEERWIVIPLILGFGIQMGLYTILKKGLFIPAGEIGPSGKLTGAGGTTSTIAMVACCAHHVADVLPILGLTAAATILAQYQTVFMLAGLGTTLIGIFVMLRILYKERKKLDVKHHPGNRGLVKTFKPTTAMLSMAGFGFVIATAGTLLSSPPTPETALAVQEPPNPQSEVQYPLVLEAKRPPADWPDGFRIIDEQGTVSAAVRPLNLNQPGAAIQFEVVLNTHSVDLNMDLAALSSLTSPNGLNLIGANWDAPLSGHHISGTLSFDLNEAAMELLAEADQLTLVIRDLDAPERIFTWER